ncbi:Kinesin-like protein unc-104 [Diplonema papillatum]|nr:Kinesin-like protein unc-104 [Diplonema papillatum]
MSSVQVAVRVRPLSDQEQSNKASCILSVAEKEITVKVPHTNGAFTHKFAYDHTLWSVSKTHPKYASQESVFKEVGVSVVDSCFEGFNVCVFAYGQTGSGKSYTMFGDIDGQHDIGLIPRVTHKIFNEIAAQRSSLVKFKVVASYMEIYNERVRCLLDPSLDTLKVREHPETGPYVEDLTQTPVESHQEVFRLMDSGNQLRTTAATNMNAHSSRSHALFQLQVTQEILMEDCDEVLSSKTAKLNLVDLAGSERASKTNATGVRLVEGGNINKSLATLGQVISALADQATAGKKQPKHIPYRDSVLTWILKENLGGNSKTIMLAAVSPAEDSYEETMSTLRYAERAKKIVNKAVVNEDSNTALVAALKEEISRLQAQLSTQSTPNTELEQNEALMKQLEMTWEEKLNRAQKLMQERGEEIKNVFKKKAELEGQVEGLMLERNKTTQQLQELQTKLSERESQVEEVTALMQQKQQEYEGKLQEMEREKNSNSNKAVTYQHSLTELRQEMAVMHAAVEAQKKSAERKRDLEAGLPHKVKALLHTLQRPSVSPEEKELLQNLTVKDMAMVYDRLGEGDETPEVWHSLMLRLEARHDRKIQNFDTALDALLDEEDETSHTQGSDGQHGLFAGDHDELECFSPTRSKQPAASSLFQAQEGTASVQPDVGTMADEGPPLDHADEEDVLNSLLDDANSDKAQEEDDAGKLLDDILGKSENEEAEKDDVDALMDDLIDDTNEKDAAEADLDALLDGSSEGGEEDQNLLDELLDDEPRKEVHPEEPGSPDRKPRQSMLDQKMEHHDPTAPLSDEEGEDVLDDLLGDAVNVTPQRGTRKIALPQTRADELFVTSKSDGLDGIRTAVWNVALFNGHTEVASKGDDFVASILSFVLKSADKTAALTSVAADFGGVVPKKPGSDPATRLRNFYCFYNKSKIGYVDSLLKEKGDDVIAKACEKYMGAEPVLLDRPPPRGVVDLINSNWFWGPVLSGRGPPPYIPENDDDVGGMPTTSHPLAGSPQVVRKEGKVDETDYWRARLTRFFDHHGKGKRNKENIEQMLQNFKGVENVLMEALVRRFGPEPGTGASADAPASPKSKQTTAFGSTANPIRIEVNAVQGHGALLCGFKVMKFNPNLGKMKKMYSKDRVWVVDLYERRFCNLSGGKTTQIHPSSHLFRIEKLLHNSKHLRLSFYKAPHPFLLEFCSTEARQRFFELSWAMRRHICWLPDLVPKSHHTASVNIIGKSKKHKEISGTVNLHLTREPMEMLTVWGVSFSMHHTVPKAGSTMDFAKKILPSPPKYDLLFLCVKDLPEVFSSHPSQLVNLFRPFCQEHDLHPFLSTNLGGSTHVVMALSRKRHISKVANMEAIELKDQNTDVVAVSMRYGESSLAVVMAFLSPRLPPGKRNQKVVTIMKKLDIGDLKLEFTSRFDFVVWLGCLGYEGSPFEADDRLAEEINASRILCGFKEPPASKADNFRNDSSRFLVRASRPATFKPLAYTTVLLEGPAFYPPRMATVFAGAFGMQRPFLGSLVQTRAKPSGYYFHNLALNFMHEEYLVDHFGTSLSMAVMCPFMEGASVLVTMKWKADVRSYIAVDEDAVPPVRMVTNAEEFLQQQTMSFSVLPSTNAAAAPAKKSEQQSEFPYASWATGLLALRHYTGPELAHFQVKMYRTGLKAGTLTGEICRLPANQSLTHAIKRAKEMNFENVPVAE